MKIHLVNRFYINYRYIEYPYIGVFYMDRDNKNKEIEILLNEFIKDMTIPTQEESEEIMKETVYYMSRGREALEHVCYKENCPYRLRDDSDTKNSNCDYIDVVYDEELDDYLLVEDYNEEVTDNLKDNNFSNDKEYSLMEDLNDISASILSDIYGG